MMPGYNDSFPAAGVRVGAVRTISEQPVRQPQPVYFARGAAAETASTVPVAKGEQTFRVRVHVVFMLENHPAG